MDGLPSLGLAAVVWYSYLISTREGEESISAAEKVQSNWDEEKGPKPQPCSEDEMDPPLPGPEPDINGRICINIFAGVCCFGLIAVAGIIAFLIWYLFYRFFK